jgi:hypothetical protein
MCNAHYQRHRSGRDMGAPIRPYQPGEWGKWTTNGQGYVQRERISEGVREYQLQHSLVMEEVLGRPLLAHENVHHINGFKDDNRPENLELWSRSQPPGQRVEEKTRWAIEWLSKYAPGVLS